MKREDASDKAVKLARAEKTIKASLAALGIPVRGSYSSGEVCGILGIVDRTFWRLCARYERDENGRLKRPDCLQTFMLSNNRRVSYIELVEFIMRNNELDRLSKEQ